jgi:Flp pilus assembly protein CpaB
MATIALTPVTPARALRAPRRIDARKLFGFFIALVATGGSLAFWSVSSDTRAVLVATRDLPVGARVTAGDLAIARVRVDDTMYQAAIPAAEQSGIVGKQASEPVHAHQLLARAQFAGRDPLGPDQLAISVPVTAETAAGGRMRPGDSVQVLATANKGKPESRTYVVLPRVTVYDVGYDERFAVVNTAAASAGAAGTGSGGGADTGDRGGQGRPASVTLLVTQEQALAIAQARWNADLDLALLPPER